MARTAAAILIDTLENWGSRFGDGHQIRTTRLSPEGISRTNLVTVPELSCPRI